MTPKTHLVHYRPKKLLVPMREIPGIDISHMWELLDYPNLKVSHVQANKEHQSIESLPR